MGKIKFFLFSLIFIIMGTPMFSQHMIIEGNEIPNKSIQFLNKYYNDNTKYGTTFYLIEYTDKNKIKEFEVHFGNGTIIEFDKYGNLKSIECGNNDIVPLSIIPSRVINALKKYTYNFNIVEYDINKKRSIIYYEIELINGKEFLFNKYGKLKK